MSKLHQGIIWDKNHNENWYKNFLYFFRSVNEFGFVGMVIYKVRKSFTGEVNDGFSNRLVDFHEGDIVLTINSDGYMEKVIGERIFYGFPTGIELGFMYNDDHQFNEILELSAIEQELLEFDYYNDSANKELKLLEQQIDKKYSSKRIEIRNSLYNYKDKVENGQLISQLNVEEVFELRAIYKRLFQEVNINPEMFNIPKPIEQSIINERLPWFSDMTYFKVAGNSGYIKEILDRDKITYAPLGLETRFIEEKVKGTESNMPWIFIPYLSGKTGYLIVGITKMVSGEYVLYGYPASPIRVKYMDSPENYRLFELDIK